MPCFLVLMHMLPVQPTFMATGTRVQSPRPSLPECCRAGTSSALQVRASTEGGSDFISQQMNPSHVRTPSTAPPLLAPPHHCLPPTAGHPSTCRVTSWHGQVLHVHSVNVQFEHIEYLWLMFTTAVGFGMFILANVLTLVASAHGPGYRPPQGLCGVCSEAARQS